MNHAPIIPITPSLLRQLRRLAIASLVLAFAAMVRAQETWTAIASPATQNLWSVCYGAGQFVAVGEGGTILTSPEGVAWTRRTSGNTLWLVGVGFGNGLFVVVGDQGTILTSADGVTWTTRRTGGTRINAVAYGNGMFLAIDEGGGSWSSVDGVTWTFRNTARSESLRGLVYAAPIFVLTGNNGTVQTTFDGQTFTTRPISSTIYLETIAYGRQLFVAIGGSATFTSRDATTWIAQPTSPVAPHGVGFFNNQFVGVDHTGLVATSFDGTAWTPRTTGANQLLIAFAANETTALAVGFGGTILRSPSAPHPPAFVAPPARVDEAAGNNVLLNVTAAGSTPLAFQWSFNGTAIPGATSDSVLLTNITSTSAGNYSVMASNSVGSASASTTLTVRTGASIRTDLIDSSFSSGVAFNVPPSVVLEQPDGKLLVGGSFTFLNGSLAQTGIVRLQRNGSLDPMFAVGSGVGGGTVDAVALQNDGRVLISGGFTSVNGTQRQGLARLNSDGSLDNTFAPSSTTLTTFGRLVGVQPDNTIILQAGSGFNRVLRDGTFASSIPINNDFMGAAVLAPDGKIVFTSGFRTQQLNPDGTTDITFDSSSPVIPINPGIRYSVLRTRAFLDGKVGIVLLAETVPVFGNPIFRTWTALLLNNDGSTNRAYQLPGATSFSYFAFASDQRLYFVTSDGSVARDLSSGLSDPNFSFPAMPGNAVSFVQALNSGESIAYGSFTGPDAISRPNLKRFHAINVAAPLPPSIGPATPATLTLNAGESYAVRVNLAGTAPFTAQINGAPAVVNGNAIEITENDAQQSVGYVFTVTNAAGSVTSFASYVRVAPSAPVFTQQPQDAAAIIAYGGGGTATFIAATRGTAPVTYQWFFNGVPLPGATSARLTVTGTFANNGTYSVTARNSVGQTSSLVARLVVDPASRIVNLASRGFAGTAENALIVGFAVSGSTPKAFLIRGAGPVLAKFGISGTLADPQLALYDSAGKIVAQNDDWGTAFPLGLAAFDAVGAFRFDAGSRDSALVATLPPGLYTAVISGRNGTTGVALAEIYDADTTASRLVNLSSRLVVSGGEQVAIPGIIVSGTLVKTFLIRAVGPTLSSFGVQNPIADPQLTVVSSSNATLAANDNWGAATNAAEIAATFANVGAFALPAASRDAAVIVTLPPGAYTALVSGANGSTGVALVEVYEVP